MRCSGSQGSAWEPERRHKFWYGIIPDEGLTEEIAVYIIIVTVIVSVVLFQHGEAIEKH